MKKQNSNSTADLRSASHNFAAVLLFVIAAITLAACSTATKPAETKAPETNKASTNNAANSSSTSKTGGDLAGTYTVNGTGPDGKSYDGEMVVTKRDAVYQMSWKTGDDSYDGVALQSGNTIAAAYSTGTDGKGCGAIVYKVNADGSLDGTWGEWGVNSSGNEKAIPEGGSKDGTGAFTATGINADGSPYKGKLNITKGGSDVYQFAWSTGNNYIGTGIRMGDYLAAGSGAKQCGFVIYEAKGDTLEGKWGVPGSTSLGTEKAIKK